MVFKGVNPIKKRIVRTECSVHKLLNIQAVIILKNDGYTDASRFFDEHMEYLNSGAVWADQDLKSHNHFYNPYWNKGLYGSSSALKECVSYYTAALCWWDRGDTKKSAFYLGAACHLIQDMTVPQHVNLNLMKHHRRYENWVRRAYDSYDAFKCTDGGIYLGSIRSFIEANAFAAIKAYNRYRSIGNLNQRFFNISRIVLCQAQRTTAGVLNMFYGYISAAEYKKDKSTV